MVICYGYGGIPDMSSSMDLEIHNKFDSILISLTQFQFLVDDSITALRSSIILCYSTFYFTKNLDFNMYIVQDRRLRDKYNMDI